MRLILMGCEYVGTTTLSRQIIKWVKANLGDEFGFHDHWKLPHVSHPNITEGSTMEEMWEAWE